MKLAGLCLLSTAAAMKLPRGVTEDVLCAHGECVKQEMKYEKIMPSQPGYQWNDAGGYCGSWATQRAALVVGAYFSQQQVRNHTVPGGGHDNEILSTNIDVAFKNLKVEVDGFDFHHETVPQQPAYFKWLKKQLVSGFSVVWMIMWDGQVYPLKGYDTPLPYGLHGHVEPVIGVQSNNPLTNETVFDDDKFVHYTDAGLNTVYKSVSTLSGDWAGEGSSAQCHDSRYCIGPYSYGWAIKGFTQDSKNATAAPASLHIDPSRSEPDTRSGSAPNQIEGTLTATDLKVGTKYDIYRWDTVEDAFTYSSIFKKTSFVADSTTFTYKDPKTFISNGVTYYRVVEQ